MLFIFFFNFLHIVWVANQVNSCRRRNKSLARGKQRPFHGMKLMSVTFCCWFFLVYSGYGSWKIKLGSASNFRCVVPNYSTHNLNKGVSLVIKYVCCRISWVRDRVQAAEGCCQLDGLGCDFVNYCVFYLCTYKAEMIKSVCVLITLSFQQIFMDYMQTFRRWVITFLHLVKYVL